MGELKLYNQSPTLARWYWAIQATEFWSIRDDFRVHRVFTVLRLLSLFHIFDLEICSKEKQVSIWTILFIILLIAWIGGFTVFHVAGGLIHLLLVFAVISLILHFVLGRRTV
jgi:hypothetical protein